MAIDKKLVQDLEKALLIYEGYQEGGQFSPLQVDQVRSQLLSARNTVLTDEQFVNNALDQFKQVLGVPVNMPLILDDSQARSITRQLDRYYEVLAEADVVYKLVDKQDQLAPDKLRGEFLKITATEPLFRGTAFQKKLPDSWQVWAKLTDDGLKDRQIKLKEQHRVLLELKTDLEMKGKTLSEQDARSMSEAEFEMDLGSFEQELRRYETRPWEKLPQEETAPLAENQVVSAFRLFGAGGASLGTQRAFCLRHQAVAGIAVGAHRRHRLLDG